MTNLRAHLWLTPAATIIGPDDVTRQGRNVGFVKQSRSDSGAVLALVGMRPPRLPGGPARPPPRIAYLAEVRHPADFLVDETHEAPLVLVIDRDEPGLTRGTVDLLEGCPLPREAQQSLADLVAQFGLEVECGAEAGGREALGFEDRAVLVRA